MTGEILRELQLMAAEASVVIVRDGTGYAYLLPNVSRKSFAVSCSIHVDLSAFVSNYCGDVVSDVFMTLLPFRSRS